MNKIQFFSVCTLLFSMSLIINANAVDEEISSESDVAIPDIVIDFNDKKNWYGLESGQTSYWSS